MRARSSDHHACRRVAGHRQIANLLRFIKERQSFLDALLRYVHHARPVAEKTRKQASNTAYGSDVPTVGTASPDLRRTLTRGSERQLAVVGSPGNPVRAIASLGDRSKLDRCTRGSCGDLADSRPARADRRSRKDRGLEPAACVIESQRTRRSKGPHLARQRRLINLAIIEDSSGATVRDGFLARSAGQSESTLRSLRSEVECMTSMRAGTRIGVTISLHQS